MDYLSAVTCRSVLYAGAENCRIAPTVRLLIRLSHDYSQHNNWNNVEALGIKSLQLSAHYWRTT